MLSDVILSFAVTASDEGLRRLTVKLTLSPSLTSVLSVTKDSCGRGVGAGSGSKIGLIVTTALLSPILALLGSYNSTVKMFVLGCVALVDNITTSIVCSVCPGVKVRMPELAV